MRQVFGQFKRDQLGQGGVQMPSPHLTQKQNKMLDYKAAHIITIMSHEWKSWKKKKKIQAQLYPHFAAKQ